MTNKIYMKNSYLREIEANIVSREYINNKYHIKLDRTIFYPDLVGGQPRDLGTINGVEITSVYEDGKDIGHIVKEDIKEDKVKLIIDWNNRFDMMQQHSGQHLLSSCFQRIVHGNTVGFYIGRDYDYIDLDIDSLSEEEANRTEYLANKIIHSNFPMKSYFVSEEQIKKLPLKKGSTVKENIRIVEIDGLDYSPCGGTHVSSTGEIGIIKIRKWYRSKGNIRVEFVAGNRALEDYARKTRYIRELGVLLSSKDKDIVYKTKSLYYKKEDLEKENRLLREELTYYKAQAYLGEAKKIKNISYLIKGLEDVDLKEINSLAHLLNKEERLIQIYATSNNNSGQFLIARSDDLDIDLKDIFNIVKNDQNIRGGGSPQIIQGGAPIDDLEKIVKSFLQEIKDYYNNI